MPLPLALDSYNYKIAAGFQSFFSLHTTNKLDTHTNHLQYYFQLTTTNTITYTTPIMSANTVYVKNISTSTSEKEIKE